MDTYHWSPPFLLEYLGFLLGGTERELEGGQLRNTVKELPSIRIAPARWHHVHCLGAAARLGAGSASPANAQKEKLRDATLFAQGGPEAKWWAWDSNP